MAQRFDGVVIVRCNCEHAIAGAPISVSVIGDRGTEFTASGTTNAFGFFTFNYSRGSQPVDVRKVIGQVMACGQTVPFESDEIKMGVDWKAVLDRINATRKLPRGFTLEDLKAQVEYFTFTSLDIVRFSNLIEVEIKCHEDCTLDADNLEHGAQLGGTDAVAVAPDFHIYLDCPTELPEVVTGMIYGMGTGATEAEAQASAKARAGQLAADKAKAVQAHYRCKDGCKLIAEVSFTPPTASKGFTYDGLVPASQYMSLAVTDWTVSLRCKN